jgi:MFS family permease
MSAVVTADVLTPEAGSLEARYRESAAFRAASDQTRVTPTHIHIAVANGLGWGFDGMDGVIFALASPLIIKDFALSIGFLGFWGPSMILTSEVFPTRIRGIGNGFSWSVAWVFGFILWPFLAVGLQQRTGSFAAAFLLIPAAMACMALGVWWFTPDYAGKELDHIAT